MSTAASKILYYLIQSYMLKRKIYYASATDFAPMKFMKFLETTTGGVL